MEFLGLFWIKEWEIDWDLKFLSDFIFWSLRIIVISKDRDDMIFFFYFFGLVIIYNVFLEKRWKVGYIYV